MQGTRIQTLAMVLARSLALTVCVGMLWVLTLVVTYGSVIALFINIKRYFIKYSPYFPTDITHDSVDLFITDTVASPVLFAIQALLAPSLIFLLSNKNFRGRPALCNFLILWAFLSILLSIVAFADICQRYGIRDMTDKGNIVHEAPACLYFSIVTWTTLGYGDFAPTPILRGFAALESFVGYLSMGLLIVALTSWASMTRSTELKLRVKDANWSDDPWYYKEFTGYISWISAGGKIPRPSVGLWLLLIWSTLIIPCSALLIVGVGILIKNSILYLWLHYHEAMFILLLQAQLAPPAFA